MVNLKASPFVIIDGSSYLFRAYHALPPLVTSKGQPTGAIYGVVSMIKNNLQRFSPKQMVVVFDAPGKNFRHDLYAEYKANRSETPSDLISQFEPLNKIIRAMGIKILSLPYVEADDVIATLAHDFVKYSGSKSCLISTSDKDLAQLVNENVILVNTMSDYIMDRDGVYKKFNVYPEQIVDYLALIGDQVDNIPGVHKCGPKTAVKWLNTYGSLDQLIINADSITGKVGENLRATIPLLPLYKELVTVNHNLKLNIDDFIITEPDIHTLKELYTELEFKGLLKEINNLQPKDKSTVIVESLDVTIDNIKAFLSMLKNSKNIALMFDLEAIVVCCGDNKLYRLSQDLLTYLAPIFASRVTLIGYDLKEFVKLILKQNLILKCDIFDLKLATYLINSIQSNDLDSIINRHNFSPDGLSNIEKIAYFHQIYTILMQEIRQLPKIYDVLFNIEIPLITVLSKMENIGVLVDVSLLHELSQRFGEQLNLLQEQIYHIAGCVFNLSSPKQLQEILYDRMQLPVLKKTPTGLPSTDESVLQELSADFEVPRLMLEYRGLFKLKSTYTDRLIVDSNNADKRVHTKYQQMVTTTGRLSSIDPNLQNIPIKTANGRLIRDAFIAAENKILIAADYSQIELRIMAHLSQDPILIESFKQNIDVHKVTASEVFGVAIENVDEQMRRQAKAINFGLIYGMSAFGLSKQLNISRSDANKYIETYFNKFKLVQQFMQDTRLLAAENGYVETMFGRRVYLPEIKSSQAALRAQSERAAINAPMQGGQADIIKIAMLRIDEVITKMDLDLNLLLQVHDELIFESCIEKAEEYAAIIAKQMEKVVDLSVPLVVDIGIGKNWNLAK